MLVFEIFEAALSMEMRKCQSGFRKLTQVRGSRRKKCAVRHKIVGFKFLLVLVGEQSSNLWIS
jgi:hypothetical protein